MELGHFAPVVGQVVDGYVIDFGDHVAAGEVDVFGEACGFDFGYYYAGELAHSELVSKIGREFFHVQAELAGVSACSG